MVGKKWYYIVCNDGQVEVVHPLQIEKDDNILFKCFSEIWWKFQDTYKVYEIPIKDLEKWFRAFEKKFMEDHPFFERIPFDYGKLRNV